MFRPSEPEILIVDDKPDKILALEAVLSELSPPVGIVRANSGREALRYLLNRKFAVILLDVNMPGMDGFETAALIRERPATENTPIIFITAFGDEPLMAKGYRLGAVDYIHTPVIPEVLQTKVQVFVELARQTEQIKQQARNLQHRAAQLSAMASQLAQAEQRERRRLARLLHDHLQQLLVAAKMRVTSLKFANSNPDSVADKLDDVERLISESISASRSLTVQLSPPVLYDAGLGAALIWLARRMKSEHGLEVIADIDESTEPVAEDIRVMLFQAARELLFNIIKHANATQANVTLRRCADDDSRICLLIEDNGAGFSADAIELASANGVHPSDSREHFGLFSIRERLALLDGSMEIANGENGGSRITLVAPTNHVGASEEASATPDLVEMIDDGASRESPPRSSLNATSAGPRGERGPANGERIRVVLADDHEILRKGIAMLLAQDAKLQVVGEASDGREALRLVEELQPDIVVMDVNMPVMSGIDATRQISAQFPEVAVIGLSMHDEEDLAKKMLVAGAALYLAKGGPGDTLLAAIRAHTRVREGAASPANGKGIARIG